MTRSGCIFFCFFRICVPLGFGKRRGGAIRFLDVVCRVRDFSFVCVLMSFTAFVFQGIDALVGEERERFWLWKVFVTLAAGGFNRLT